jgi:hypothetical protein
VKVLIRQLAETIRDTLAWDLGPRRPRDEELSRAEEERLLRILDSSG